MEPCARRSHGAGWHTQGCVIGSTEGLSRPGVVFNSRARAAGGYAVAPRKKDRKSAATLPSGGGAGPKRSGGKTRGTKAHTDLSQSSKSSLTRQEAWNPRETFRVCLKGLDQARSVRTSHHEKVRATPSSIRGAYQSRWTPSRSRPRRVSLDRQKHNEGQWASAQVRSPTSRTTRRGHTLSRVKPLPGHEQARWPRVAIQQQSGASKS